jgi:hypothetical protein
MYNAGFPIIHYGVCLDSIALSLGFEGMFEQVDALIPKLAA